MKIALIGASGHIGSRILSEALSRGHQVTAIVREPSKITTKHNNLHVVAGDVLNTEDLAAKLKGHDIVISAFSPGFEKPFLLVDASSSIIKAVKKAAVDHLISVGGAGSLEVAPGVQLMNTSHFPAAWKNIAQAHADALKVYQAEKDLKWTNFSPAALIEPGMRTGKFRLGENQLIADAQGNSKISMEDYAIAMMDEAENPKHIKKRFTIGY